MTFEQAFNDVLGIDVGTIATSAADIPASGTAIGGILSLGVSNPEFADNKAVDNAIRLVSMYRASLTEDTGTPRPEYIWLYNQFNCYLHQRSKSLQALVSTDSGRSSDTDDRESTELAKMTTLKNKHTNAKRQLTYRRVYFWLTFAALAVYALGIGVLITGNSGMAPEMERSLIIGMSATVLVGVLLYSIYRTIVSMQVMENFASESECEVFTTDNVGTLRDTLVASMREYLRRVKVLQDYGAMMEDTGNVEMADLANTLLNDYENLNYVNMRRYEIVRYKLDHSNFNMRFLMYGFVIVSILGLVRGSTVKEGPMAGLFKMIAFVLVLIYFVSYLMHFKNNQLRKHYNYKQMYWNSNNLKKTDA